MIHIQHHVRWITPPISVSVLYSYSYLELQESRRYILHKVISQHELSLLELQLAAVQLLGL